MGTEPEQEIEIESEPETTKKAKMIEVLKEADEWLTSSEWASKLIDAYPEVGAAADEKASKWANPKSGLRSLAGEINSCLVNRRGPFAHTEVDKKSSPQKTRYVEEIEKLDEKEKLSEVEDLTRTERIRQDSQLLTENEKRLIEGINEISKQFKKSFHIRLEVDHAQAIMNEDGGKHHPGNLQLLTEEDNRCKSSDNWERFTFEEQYDYLERLFENKQMRFDVNHDLFEILLKQLGIVY